MTDPRHPKRVDSLERFADNAFIVCAQSCENGIILPEKEQVTANIDCRDDSHLFATGLLAGVDCHTATVGLGSELISSAVDVSHNLIAVGIGATIQRDGNWQIGVDVPEVRREIHI